MAKAKAKPRAKAKAEKAVKETDNKTTKASDKKLEDANPLEMRRKVTNIVGEKLDEITDATVGEAKKGQLATVKYLFEVVGLYPPSTDAFMGNPEEDTFMQRVVRRLGLPEGPLPSEEDDPPEKLVIPAAKRDEPITVAEENNSSGTAEEAGNVTGEAATEGSGD
jgi:hypothetical protein